MATVVIQNQGGRNKEGYRGRDSGPRWEAGARSPQQLRSRERASLLAEEPQRQNPFHGTQSCPLAPPF